MGLGNPMQLYFGFSSIQTRKLPIFGVVVWMKMVWLAWRTRFWEYAQGTIFEVSNDSWHSQCSFLSLLLLDQDMISQLFLPPCLCYTIMDSNHMKRQTQLKAFFSKLPWPWFFCCRNRKVIRHLAFRSSQHKSCFINKLDILFPTSITMSTWENVCFTDTAKESS